MSLNYSIKKIATRAMQGHMLHVVSGQFQRIALTLFLHSYFHELFLPLQILTQIL